jgi:type I restriction enzyme M protein
MNNFSDKVSFIWSVADLLRGPYKPNQYGKVILPLTVLRRLDCVLEPTRQKVRDKADELKRKGTPISNLEPVLNRAAMPSDWPKDRPFPLHNTSKFDFQALKGDPNNIAKNLTHYIKNFSSKAREIIEYFGFAEQIEKLDKANRLYLVVSKFADIDLHPGAVSNVEMGYIFEELIRKFSEAANETAGDHFTPREVIRLIVNALSRVRTSTTSSSVIPSPTTASRASGTTTCSPTLHSASSGSPKKMRSARNTRP